MKKFYLTTAIDYINDVIHLGHGYQKVVADVLARYHRLLGEEVFFLTGADEHGFKAQEAASKAGMSPQAFADKITTANKEQLKSLNISYDRYIRTSDQDHQKMVQEFFKRVEKTGDIYLADFEGIYCSGCEEYKTESDLVDGHCPFHPRLPLQKLKEKNYFFAWSKYEDFLKSYLQENPSFVQPESRRQEMLSFLEKGLEDISISRQNISWGIPVPGDPKQTIYVWFDALINYLTGAPQGFWPADLHLLGKDNTRWHALLWPAMLKSADFPLPETVYAHGFISFGGEKISKSAGNLIRPKEVAEKFGSDGARYLLVSCKNLADDGEISWEKMAVVYNADLANGLGNLAARLIGLSRNCGWSSKAKWPNFLEVASGNYREMMGRYQLREALASLREEAAEIDRYLNQNEPWKIKDEEKLLSILAPAQEKFVRLFALLEPFLPQSAAAVKKIFAQKNLEKAPLLFPKIER